MPFFKKKKEVQEDKEEDTQTPAASVGGGGSSTDTGDSKSTAKEDGSGSVGEMKAGDYMIHIFIEKTKELETEQDSTIDPIIQFECLNKKHFSSTKNDIGGLEESTWSEHIFIEKNGLSKTQAENAKINIKILDKGVFKDTMIGVFDLDMSFVYFMKNHTLFHKWLALSNPGSADFSKITGYLKMSISVSTAGDEQIQIEEDDDENGDQDIMMSPALNPKFFQLKIRIFQGQDLPMMDHPIGFIGKEKIDAYMKCTVGNKKKYKTDIIIQEKGGPPCNWNTEFWIPAQLPVINPKIILKLMDQDDIGADETAGSILINTKDVIEGMYNGQFMWKNVMGSPLKSKNNDAKKRMNEDPSYASTWKGRVLIQIEAYETDKPVSKQCKIIDEDLILSARQLCEDREYHVIAEIGQAVALPTNKKYEVLMTIGGHQFRFEPYSQSNPTNYKRYKRTQQTTIRLPYANCDDFDNVTIQLMDGEKPVCYHVEDLSSFEKEKCFCEVDECKKVKGRDLFKWVQLKPDHSVNKIKNEYQAGMISFKLAIHDVTKDGGIDYSECEIWNKRESKRQNPIKIRSYVYQCRDLPSADKDGSSDPFVEIWDPSQNRKTSQVISDTTNPLFYEVIELDYEVADETDLSSYPPFILDVYDYDDDLFDSTPDFLCRAVIEATNCAIVKQEDFEICDEHQEEQCYECAIAGKTKDVPEIPQWHPMKFNSGGPQCGEILVSFAISSQDYEYPIAAEVMDLKDRVEFKEFDVSMQILGLRNLQSPGILPVKKAFILFNLTSVVPPNSTSVRNIKTQPQNPGPNPTINTIMEFTLPLPTDPLYCPKLSCQVFDYIYKGFNQPIIGTFTLPMGQLMLDLIEERETETKQIQDIIDQIGEIMEKNMDEMIANYQRKSVLNSKRPILNFDSQSANEYSADENDNNDEDIEARKSKKKYQKAFKGAENENDFKEGLGANEIEGNNLAIARQTSQIEIAQKLRKELFSKQESVGESIDAGDQASGGVQKSSSGLTNKSELMKQYEQLKEMEKRISLDERKRDMEQEMANREDADDYIIMPQYQLDKRLNVSREFNAPPSSAFLGIGWDEHADQGKKHYRRYFPDELENIEEIFTTQMSPFNTFTIMRGQSRGAKKSGFSLFSKSKKKDSSGQTSTLQEVGSFKGIIEVESKEAKEIYQETKKNLIAQIKMQINALSMKLTQKPYIIDTSKLGSMVARNKLISKMKELGLENMSLTKHLCNLESDEILKQQLLQEKKCIVRVYMISGFDMATRDIGSLSDPYPIIECNKKIHNERKNYQLNEANPKFHKCYEFESVFPGSTPLNITMMDYDEIFGDDLIGSTSVDLEDRYFSMDWQSLEHKPIEYRQIYHPSSSVSQGQIIMWIEINTLKQNVKQIKWDPTPKPDTELQVRVCILDCRNFVTMDIEGTTDAFIKGYFDSAEDSQETDCHYRCQDGKPDFQYRMIFNIKVPRKDYKLNLQAYDRDFLKSNDILGQGSIDIQDILEDCCLIKQPLTLNNNYYESVMKQKGKVDLKFDSDDSNCFWVNMMSKDSKTGKIESNGEVRIRIDVLPAQKAIDNPVGKARDTPNHSPFLKPPEGRIEFSVNPMKMINQLIGPEFRAKVKAMLGMIICIGICILLAPQIISNLVVKVIVG